MCVQLCAAVRGMRRQRCYGYYPKAEMLCVKVYQSKVNKALLCTSIYNHSADVVQRGSM